MKSGFVLKHSPNLPASNSERMRGIFEIRMATASTSPFSVCLIYMQMKHERNHDRKNQVSYFSITPSAKDTYN